MGEVSIPDVHGGDEGLTYLLSVVKEEAREDGGSSVCADGLESGQGPERHAGHDHGGETRADENTEPGEERSTCDRAKVSLRSLHEPEENARAHRARGIGRILRSLLRS